MLWPDDMSFEGFSKKIDDWYDGKDFEIFDPPNNLEFNSDYVLCMLNDKYLNSQIYAISEQLCYINANLKKIRQHNSNVHKEGNKSKYNKQKIFRDAFEDITTTN